MQVLQDYYCVECDKDYIDCWVDSDDYLYTCPECGSICEKIYTGNKSIWSCNCPTASNGK